MGGYQLRSYETNSLFACGSWRRQFELRALEGFLRSRACEAREYLMIGLFSVLSMGVLCVSPLHAQVDTADVLGAVTDQTGAAVPGAKITLTNLKTGVTTITESNEVGYYVFNLLIPGHYSVVIEASGFKKVVFDDIALAAGDRAREDGALAAGSIEQTVNVNAAPPLLQTDSSALTSVVTEQSVQDLPLEGRNFVNLVQILPGVNQGQSSAISSGTRPDNRQQTSTVVANGQPDIFNNQMIDGMDNNEREQGFLMVVPSIESIAEVKVDTNAYSAEIGRNAGAVINIITKSGTNSYHGSAYEFFRNDIFDARNFFTYAPDPALGRTGTPKPEYRQNQFGASVGGPIVKRKTFFFADVEDDRIILGEPTGLLTVPTAAEQASGGTDFTDNRGSKVPASAINPAGLAYFKMFPAPNTGAPGALVSNYSAAPNQTQYSLTLDGRIDQHFKNGDQFFGRYVYNNLKTVVPSAFPAVSIGTMTVQTGGNPGSYPGPSTNKGHGVGFNYVHLLSQNLVLELKAGYSRMDIETLPINANQAVSSAIGIVNANTPAAPYTGGLMPVSFSSGGYATLGNPESVPILDRNNTFQYMGSLTYTHNAHNIKAGAQLIRRQLNYFQNNIPIGIATFSGGVTGNALEDLVEGKSLSYSRNNTLIEPGYRTWETSEYVQDDWRLTHSLTVNLGLRYDVFTAFTEAHNRYSNFDYPTLSIINGSQSPHIGIDTNYKNFGPRIGFSKSLRNTTVLRSGYGISYYPNAVQGIINLVNAPYGYNTGTVTNPNWWPILPIPSSSPTVSGSPTYIPKNTNTAYVQQFNLMVQQAVGANVFTLGGVGELSRHLRYNTSVNLPSPNGPYPNDTTQGPQATPPLVTATTLPGVGLIKTTAPWGTGNYYALQAVFARRFTRGLAFNGNYTWAHGLSDGLSGSGSFAATGLDPYNAKHDYGNSAVDVRHRFAVNWTYELPVGKNTSGAEALLLKGWESNFILFWQTGLPFTVTDSELNKYHFAQVNLPNITADVPNVGAGQSFKASSSPSITGWLNRGAFTPQAAGTFGNERNLPFYGPHLRRADMSFLKNFNVTEKVSGQFRAECYNISNTPNFSNPNASISSWNPGSGHDATHPISLPSTGPCSVPGACTAVGLLPGDIATNGGGFGTITSTVINNNPRQFQFALKLLF